MLFRSARREDHDFDLRVTLVQLPGDLQSMWAGHIQIEEKEVWRCTFARIKNFLPIAHCCDVLNTIHLGQDGRDAGAYEQLIVGNHDSNRGCRRHQLLEVLG